MLSKRVAVVDDDLEMGSLVQDVLVSEGFEVQVYTSVAEALVQFKKGPLPTVLITDLRMKDIDGMMFLKKMRESFPSVTCIMMTAFGSIETAIEAMRLGAYHYIVKPFKNDDLLLQVNRSFERARLLSDNTMLRRELKKEFSIESLIGKSSTMQNLFEVIKRVSQANANVLIRGESGSGKELVARAIHSLGTRKDRPFVPINCTAIPEQLLESELFGHVKGSFTGAIGDKKGLFEEANRGTLFLDEIGDLSLPLQAKLLRVLQDKSIRPVGSNELREVDVRVVSATHRDLASMIKEEKFREDLYYRLNVLPIQIPPLRDRPQDIPHLVDHFIQKFSAQNNTHTKGVTPEAMAKLMASPWPGNVRELENLIERAVVMSPNEMLTEDDIMGRAIESARESFQQLYSDNPSLDELEERYIKLILAQVGHKKEAAAKILGINRRTLYRKERQYGLPTEEHEPLLD
ncbi:MAG: sigma-54-dependent Fis family transcriptional regulator [Oligoflexia bacterium]|nr:sigma-54-dependent Fis family transcriptional regulator [Oligoflexia bacterium]